MDTHREGIFPDSHLNDYTEQENIGRDQQLSDSSESFPGDNHESDMKMQVIIRLHSPRARSKGGKTRKKRPAPLGSAEAALLNLVRNTAKHVIQEHDLHQPIARGSSLVLGDGTLPNAVQVLRHVIDLGDTGERLKGMLGFQTWRILRPAIILNLLCTLANQRMFNDRYLYQVLQLQVGNSFYFSKWFVVHWRCNACL